MAGIRCLFLPTAFLVILVSVVGAMYLMPDAPADEPEGVWPAPVPPAPQDLPRLMEAAADFDWMAREEAVRRIGCLGSDSAVQFLIQVLRNDEAPQVRAAAAEALGRLESPEAAEQLMASLRDESSVVRARAGVAMRHLVGDVDVCYRADDPAEKRQAAIRKFRFLWTRFKEHRYRPRGAPSG